jgi:hypothetical protein
MYFLEEWVQTGQAQLLYIKRTTRETDKWSGHVRDTNLLIES